MPNVPSTGSNGPSPFHEEQFARYRADQLADQVAQADRRSQLDAEREASGQIPWWRRLFRRKHPLPYQ